MQLEDKSTPKVKLYAAAIGFTLCVGFSFFGIKKCVPYADTLDILCYRYLSALIAVIIWVAVTKKMGLHPEADKSRPKKMLYLSAAFYILFMILQVSAMFFATSIEGAIVFAMVPIFAKIIGRIVLGERSTLRQMVFVVLTVTALLILVVLNATDINLNPTGLIIMTTSSLAMACQTVSNRYIRGVFRPIEITGTIVVYGSILFVGAAVIRAIATGNIAGLLEPLHHIDFVVWVSFLGVGCILLSAMFMAYMLIYMEIVQSSIFNNASTLVSIFAGALILGEPLFWYHYLCGAIIIVGVIGLTFSPAASENAGKSLSENIKKEN